MKPLPYLLIACLAAACSPPAPSTPPTNLAPPIGAFGYNLAETNTEDLGDLMVTNSPPFHVLQVRKLEDGRICCIEASGFVPHFEFRDTKKRLIAVLEQKYGERPPGTGEYAGLEKEFHMFGPTNRTVRLNASEDDGDARISVSYYDSALMAIYRAEQDAKDKAEELKKRAGLANKL